MQASIGKSAVTEATVMFPRSGSWLIESFLDLDPMLPDRAPFVLMVDGQPRLRGEVRRTINIGGRVRFVGVALGASGLDTPCAPVFLQNVTARNVLTQLLQKAGNAVVPLWGTGSSASLESVTLWPEITPRQWASTQFDFVRFDWDSTPLVEAINPAVTDHKLIDVTALMQAEFGFGKKDFWLLPGQLGTLGTKRVRIVSSQFHLSSNPRFVCKLEDAL